MSQLLFYQSKLFVIELVFLFVPFGQAQKQVIKTLFKRVLFIVNVKAFDYRLLKQIELNFLLIAFKFGIQNIKFRCTYTDSKTLDGHFLKVIITSFKRNVEI